MRYSVKTTNHESLRNRVDEQRRATVSHKKQEDALRELKGLAAQAQLSAADMLVYAVKVERLFRKGAFAGWQSRRHRVEEVCYGCTAHTFAHSSIVHRRACKALLTRPLYL
jgi:hypothetical protein